MCPPLLQVLPCLHQHQDVVPEPFAAFQVPRPPTERKRGASGDVSLTSTTEQPLQVLLTSGCCNCAGDMTETAAQLGSLFLRRGVSRQEYTRKRESARITAAFCRPADVVGLETRIMRLRSPEILLLTWHVFGGDEKSPTTSLRAVSCIFHGSDKLELIKKIRSLQKVSCVIFVSLDGLYFRFYPAPGATGN